MGYAICIGTCMGCGRTFRFNPNRVPSIRINGVREPVCRQCVERANHHAREKGEPEFVIPANAYEAIDESELGD
jgi:hypothetical protein